ncbi:hypothetical protein SAMN05443668_12055 [Cryptosporangium aurantiacum]|uniref:Transcriptional regulator, AbiEi antitoxin, Type IV TA system n=2 Tax=Cryptosporangium aurantiacum TaxID=134849 RepID=A0A1M7RLN9_9ACTN|nr:hypothetical protein SAMN05443668_12055 [Cryptosporangium aurantiacum]
MLLAMDSDWDALRVRQHGAVTRSQLLAHGVTVKTMVSHVAAGRWQRPLPGVLVTFTGPMPPMTICWAALLYAGSGAVLSHTTAGVLWRLLPGPLAPPVHVTVPADRSPRPRRGLVVHRSSLPLEAVADPPRTSVATTIVVLCSRARRPTDVTAILGRAEQHHPGAVQRAREIAADIGNLRWRAELLAAADDVSGGAHSPLERHYLVDVERAHELPIGESQRPVGDTHQDVYYREYRTIAELDGRDVHRGADARFRDMTRDNAALVRGEVTLRYGWADVRHRPCAVAAEVAAVLRTRGWRGSPKPCGPGCRVAGAA